MAARGRVQVGGRSWHWRWYNEWRRNKGMEKTERAQIDLCHYMRVVLIFGPWRWFWQTRSLWQEVPPFIYVALLVLVGAAVFAFVAVPGVMLGILGLVAGTAVAAALVLGIGYAVRRWYIKDTEKADARLEKIGRGIVFVATPVWWPIRKLVLGIKWLGIKIGRGLYRAGDWLFTKRLFNVTIDGELISVTPFGLALCVGVPTVIVLQFVFHPIGALIVTGCLVVALLLIYGIVLLVMRIRRWAKEHPAEPQLPLKPKREHETAQLVWSWVVAKKHRVCPLIEAKQ